jgi:hypothetical protein
MIVESQDHVVTLGSIVEQLGEVNTALTVLAIMYQL